jgi:hypothetical protein
MQATKFAKLLAWVLLIIDVTIAILFWEKLTHHWYGFVILGIGICPLVIIYYKEIFLIILMCTIVYFFNYGGEHSHLWYGKLIIGIVLTPVVYLYFLNSLDSDSGWFMFFLVLTIIGSAVLIIWGIIQGLSEL